MRPRAQVGNRIGILLCSVATFVALAVPAGAQQDTKPPQLQSLSVSTNVINTSGGPQIATVIASITDDLSGVQSAGISFKAPSGNGEVSATLILSSGDTYVGNLIFPQFSSQGIWTVGFAFLRDNAGNDRSFTIGDLYQRGINVVIGNGSFETANPRQISRLNYGKTLVKAKVSAESKACDGTPAQLQRKRSTGWKTLQETWIVFESIGFRHEQLKTGAKYRVYVPSFGLGTPVLAKCGKASQRFIVES